MVFNLGNCARRDRDVYQRMNANGYCHMIFSPETKQNKAVIYLNVLSQNTITIYIQMVLYTVITYSLHHGFPLSCRTLLPVFLFALWECCPLLCCWSTAYLAPCLEGRALPHSPSLSLTPFPSGSRHLPTCSSAAWTTPLVSSGVKAYFRIIGERTGCTCILVYTVWRSPLLVNANGPGTFWRM
jgi:hypothetical protein